VRTRPARLVTALHRTGRLPRGPAAAWGRYRPARMGAETPAIRTARTSELDDATRAAVIRVCIEAHQEDDFNNLFAYLPPEGLHVLAQLDDRLVGHAVATTRWLQPEGLPLLRTAYVDAVATSPAHQGRGIGSAVMRHLASVVVDHDIACLETDRVEFYERLGWEEWRGPLAGRSDDGRVPTPDQTGVMILRLPRTPELDLGTLLTIEAHPARIW
jgi:aminoglycoside 2'-N-acetyltransferase I